MNCGLLGRKLGHSYSPQIHAALGDYSYRLFEKEPEEVESFFKSGSYTGLNVTVPYKKTIIPYLDELSPRAKALGAVNTVVRRNGRLIGHNTDYAGFAAMVKKSGIDPAGKKALVLGSGGASNTAVAVLKNMGAEVVIISRSGENNYSNLDKHQDASLIVNATPVGMYPNVEESPIELNSFPHLEGVLDVIYNPARTKLLLQAEEKGLIVENGLYMLVAQAKESAEWFTESIIDDSIVDTIYRSLRSQMENIILIGMPGSGKSTIGKLLAKELGKAFIDADTVLEEDAGRKITDIIPVEGEKYFRELETMTLAKLGARSGLVIATGGGCVTQERNYPLLHRNGSIFQITRSLEKLPTNGRPLSQAGNILEMARIREPMYHRFADYTIDNNGSPEEAVRQILTLWENRK